jgi:catechol 2,3-dioxygenase-like lactoylglutathione lyase family enzyme
MSFSHIALTVSHLPSAASFYAAALQPLGYRYIGQDGDALGFGVDSADFFITQASRGSVSS